MEANGFKKRIKSASKNSNFIKILFQYPSSDHVVVKRGVVKCAFEESFDLEEIIDGLVTYSYKYIIEIKDEVEND